jgi:3-oxoacyl-[acyl-carrier protein] reductase
MRYALVTDGNKGIRKATVHSLVINLVKFLSPLGISINSIAPGFVETEWQKKKPE